MKASARAAVLAVLVAGIDARQPDLVVAEREFRRQGRRRRARCRATRSPSVHSVSATRVTRASSAASRKNGRRNGQSRRSPNGQPRARACAPVELARTARLAGVGGKQIRARGRCGISGHSSSAIDAGLQSRRRSAPRPIPSICAQRGHDLLRLPAQRAVDHEVGHLLHDHLEVERRDAVALEVGRGVQEVDRVRARRPGPRTRSCSSRSRARCSASARRGRSARRAPADR